MLFHKKNKSVFSLNTDMKIFLSKKICILIKYRTEIFLVLKQICIFTKYRFENFSSHKIDMYFL